MTIFKEILVATSLTFANILTLHTATTTNCSLPGESFACCTDYILGDDGNCHPCEAGAYGVNCSRRCPRFHFGEGCQERCNCTNGMDCDPRNGKCELQCEVEIDKQVSLPKWSLAVGSAVVVVLILGIAGCCLACAQRTINQITQMPELKDGRPDVISLTKLKLSSEMNESRKYQFVDPHSAEQIVRPGYTSLKAADEFPLDSDGYVLPPT